MDDGDREPGHELPVDDLPGEFLEPGQRRSDLLPGRSLRERRQRNEQCRDAGKKHPPDNRAAWINAKGHGLEISESALRERPRWGLALLMRPAMAAPGVASVCARYADARTFASAIVAARWPGGSMRTSFADETGSIRTRDTNAVNPAQKAKRPVFGNLEWQRRIPRGYARRPGQEDKAHEQKETEGRIPC